MAEFLKQKQKNKIRNQIEGLIGEYWFNMWITSTCEGGLMEILQKYSDRIFDICGHRPRYDFLYFPEDEKNEVVISIKPYKLKVNGCSCQKMDYKWIYIEGWK